MKYQGDALKDARWVEIISPVRACQLVSSPGYDDKMQNSELNTLIEHVVAIAEAAGRDILKV